MACRRNDQGVWKGEVYAKRDFMPFEILLAPHTSQLKDTHLTNQANANVSLPRHGRGSHPEDGHLSLDGRCRNLLASSGSLDEQTHTGSLFWLVTRSCDPSEANMEQECAQFEATFKCSFTGSPALKKRKVDPVEWSRQEMPGIPFLFNSKPIAARTKLVMHLPSKKK